MSVVLAQMLHNYARAIVLFVCVCVCACLLFIFILTGQIYAHIDAIGNCCSKFVQFVCLCVSRCLAAFSVYLSWIFFNYALFLKINLGKLCKW